MGPAGVSALFCRQLGGLDSRRKGAESQTSPPEFASGAPGDRRGRPCGNIRTGRVRPEKPGAEGKPHRPQFLENQAPVGREEPLTATQILRAGNAQIIFRYASPAMGSGESGPMDLGGAERSRSPSAASPAILWFLSHRWKRNSPPGRRNSPRIPERKPAPQNKSLQRQTRTLYTAPPHPSLRRYTHRARSPGKTRRRRETAPAAIFGKPGPSGPGRTADRHSDLARRKCSDNFQVCVPRNGVRGKRSYGPRRSRAEP